MIAMLRYGIDEPDRRPSATRSVSRMGRLGRAAVTAFAEIDVRCRDTYWRHRRKIYGLGLRKRVQSVRGKLYRLLRRLT